VGKELTIVIKSFNGLEEVLVEEIKCELGVQDVELLPRGARFIGGLEQVYEANLKLRLAIKVMVEIHSFTAATYDEYYRELLKFPWSDHLEVSDTFRVDGTVRSERFDNSKLLEHKTKDAIVDYFEKSVNRRPVVDKKHPKFRINAQINDLRCTVLMDSTGESLEKRGYRQTTGEEAINDVLAAGLLAISGWDMKQPFVDPMCGSGTLLIEAALKTKNIYPGEFRDFYAFKYWRNFDLSMFRKTKEQLSQNRKESIGLTMTGYDLDRSVLRSAMQNAESAGVNAEIKFTRKDFFRNVKPEENTFVMANLPHIGGEEEGDTEELYSRIGAKLRADYTENKTWLVLFNRVEKRFLELSSSREMTLDNDGLHCDLVFIGPVKQTRKFKFGK
jgi:putative N6-adenine-specific DNA methylase